MARTISATAHHEAAHAVVAEDTGMDVRQKSLVLLLHRAGWQVNGVEVDLVRATARVELQSYDGRLVTLDARNGRATLTREQVERSNVTVGRRGDRCRVERLQTRFLGRDLVGLGMRSGLRALCRYLADNSPRSLPATAFRAGFASLLG